MIDLKKEIRNIIQTFGYKKSVTQSFCGCDFYYKQNMTNTNVICLIDDDFEVIRIRKNLRSAEKIGRNLPDLLGMPVSGVQFIILTCEFKKLKKYASGNCLVIDYIKGIRKGNCKIKEIETTISGIKYCTDMGRFHYEQFESLLSLEKLHSHSVGLTYLIILVNIFVFFKFGTMDDKYGLSYNLGWDKERFRLITYMFLHSNIFHLFGNMVSLYIVGSMLEMQIGFLRMSGVYLISGIYGGIASVMFNHYTGVPELVTVGASAAVYGVLGALFVTMIWKSMDKTRAIVFSGILNLGIIMIHSLIPWIDTAAHVGGYIFGAICVATILMAERCIDYIKYIRASFESC